MVQVTIKVEYLRKTGLSDPEFFFGPEDIDLSLRLRRLGKLGVNLNSTIYHSVAQSAKVTGMNQRVYYEIKSHLYLLKKISKTYFLLGNFYNLIRITYLFFLSIFITEIKNKFKLNLRSTLDLINNNLGINDLHLHNPGKEYLVKEYLKNKNKCYLELNIFYLLYYSFLDINNLYSNTILHLNKNNKYFYFNFFGWGDNIVFF